MPASLFNAHLAALLAKDAFELDDETLRAARSLGPEPAAQVVTALLDAELTTGSQRHGRTPIRAAILAQELRLTGAIPALVRCLEKLETLDPLAHAALDALRAMGAAAVGALLAAFDRCTGAELRARLAEALARTGVTDDRILRAFVRLLDDCATCGAGYLAEYGDRRALPELARALDRAALVPEATFRWTSNDDVVVLASAIEWLGGKLSKRQHAKLAEVLRLRDERWPDERSVLELDAVGTPAH
jgi:hypothetical protein